MNKPPYVFQWKIVKRGDLARLKGEEMPRVIMDHTNEEVIFQDGERAPFEQVEAIRFANFPGKECLLVNE